MAVISGAFDVALPIFLGLRRLMLDAFDYGPE